MNNNVYVFVTPKRALYDYSLKLLETAESDYKVLLFCQIKDISAPSKLPPVTFSVHPKALYLFWFKFMFNLVTLDQLLQAADV